MIAGRSWILVVEDSDPDMYFLQRALNEAKISQTVRRAHDGEQAIELLRDLAAAGRDSFPDLIVIDLNLPRVDGHEVLAHLRSQTAFQEIPVVVVTSSEAAADRKKTLAVGSDAYFIKPMDIASYCRFPDALQEARRARLMKLRDAERCN